MKIKPHHRRDFWAYVRFNRRMNKRIGHRHYFCPDANHFERGDANAITCFVQHESLGMMRENPRQPRLLKLAMDGKKLVNFHVEQWAEGLADGTIVPQDLRYHLFDLPDWVCNALHKQWMKLVWQRWRFDRDESRRA